MTAYLLKLLFLLPLVGGLAVGALWLWRKVGPGMGLNRPERLVRLVEAVPLSATAKLAVVEFGDKRLLVAVTRGRIELLSTNEAAGDD